MKKMTWLISGAAVLALALAVAWAFTPRPVEVELAPVTQGRFETTIDEDGKTRLANRYVVSAPLAGRLARITLKEGDTVAADSPLAVLSSVLPAMLDERTRRELQARVTMSSLDGITDAEFTNMMPGLLAMFEKRGWLVLLWGIFYCPLALASKRWLCSSANIFLGGRASCFSLALS